MRWENKTISHGHLHTSDVAPAIQRLVLNIISALSYSHSCELEVSVSTVMIGQWCL